MLDHNSENIDPIKNGFSQVKRKAPESLWGDIDQNLSLNNDEHLIGQAFNLVERKAPFSSWQGVKRQLIIDQVWLNISDQLNKKKKKYFWFYLSGFVAAIILGGIFIQEFKLNDPVNKTRTLSDFEQTIKTEQVVSDETVFEDQSLDLINVNKIQNGLDDNNSDKISIGHIQKNNLIEKSSSQIDEKNLSQHNNDAKNSDYSLNVNQKSDFIDSIEFSSVSKLPLTRICAIPLDHDVNNLIEPIQKYKPNFNRIEIGLITGINNTWIFNNDVKDGLNRFSLVDNNFSVGYNAGMNFVFNFNRRHSISLEIDIISKLNQRYSYFGDGNIFAHEVTISQQKYGLNYRFNTMNVFSKNQSFVFKVGTFVSKAFKSEFYSDKEAFADQVIENDDFGIKTGIGSQHRYGNFLLEYGIQSDVGLINIASSSSYNSKKFNYTTSYLTGLYCSLRYSF